MLHRIAIPAAVFVIAVFACAPAAPAQTLAEQLVKCDPKSAASMVPPQEAIDACTVLIESGNNNSDGLSYLHSRRGMARQRLGDWTLAIADFNESVRLLPNRAGPYSDRAEAYLKQRDYALAIKDFDSSDKFRTAPHVDTLNMRCRVRAIAGVEYPVAKKACDRALKIRPNNPDILDSRALLGLKLGDNQAAFNDYSVAVRWKPESASSLYGLGVALLRLGRTEEGRTRIAAAIAADAKIADQYKEYGITP